MVLESLLLTQADWLAGWLLLLMAGSRQYAGSLQCRGWLGACCWELPAAPALLRWPSLPKVKIPRPRRTGAPAAADLVAAAVT